MLRIILGILIGGVVGFILGHYGKCATGACPLTQNPISGAIIGALLGLMIVLGK